MSRLFSFAPWGCETDCGWTHRNPFDVVGARNAGMQAIWVDRAGTGWIDRAAAHTPSRVVRSLGEIVEVVKHLDA